MICKAVNAFGVLLTLAWDAGGQLAETLPPFPPFAVIEANVDEGGGQLLLREHDLELDIAGDTFRLTRIYSSKPAVIDDIDSGPSWPGVRWTMNIFHQSLIREDHVVVSTPDGAQGVFRMMRDGRYEPHSPAMEGELMVRDVIEIDRGDGTDAQRWAVLRHDLTDGRTFCYFRRPSEQELAAGVEPLPHYTLEGSVLQRRDRFGGCQTVEYRPSDEVIGKSKWMATRATRISFHAQHESIANWSVRVDLNWAFPNAEANQPPSLVGKLQSVVVHQRQAGAEYVSHDIEYRYRVEAANNAEDCCSPQVGPPGCLIQVRKRARAAADQPWQTEIVQYRYHDANLNEREADTDNDGFDELANSYQLKAILPSGQLEAAWRRHRTSTGLEIEFEQYAGHLLALDDGGPACEGVGIMDLAAVVIPMYEPSAMFDGQVVGGRVRMMYSRIGERWRDDHRPTVKLDVRYPKYVSPRNPDPPIWTSRVASVHALNRAGEYELIRRDYRDMIRVPRLVNGRNVEYCNLAHQVTDTLQAGRWTRRGIKYEYDSRGQLVARRETTRFDDYTPGSPDDPTTPEDDTVIPSLRISEDRASNS